MRGVLQVLARSEGGIRRHVRYLAAHPPRGYVTAGVLGPAELATYFEGLPFAGHTSRWPAPVDLIHAHGFSAARLALALRRRGDRRSGVPVVVTVHSSCDQTLGRSLPGARLPIVQRAAWLAGRIIARRADAVIVVAPDAAARLGGARFIPPAVDPRPPSRSRDEVRAELGTSPDAVVVLCVARLHPDKGLDLLIQALRGSAAQAWIAGEGPERRKLEQLIDGLPVRLLGHRSDVPDLLHAADIFVLPSRGDAYPLALVEARAAGLPIVATRVGAVPEVVGDAGIIVDPGDWRGLGEALDALIASEALRARLAGKDGAASSPPSAQELVARIGKIYDEVCGLS